MEKLFHLISFSKNVNNKNEKTVLADYANASVSQVYAILLFVNI